MAVVSIESIKNEMIGRSKKQLEHSLSRYEDLFDIRDNLTVEQNLSRLTSTLNSLTVQQVQDWYMSILSIDFNVSFCSLTDKSYMHKVIDFSRYDWLGLDKSRFENLLYLLSNSDTILNVDNASIDLLSKQLQMHVVDTREEIYRVIRILIITYNLELYNSVLTLSGFLNAQIHVNNLLK